MDSIIPLGQKNTLAEYMILSGAENRPPMLDKDLYDSWKSRIELYMQNREHGRMILESVENGPLIWPTIEENGVTRTKKYAELSTAEKIQADYDMKATNIILQGLPADIYSLVNHHRVAKDLWERVQLLMQGTSLTKQERECKLYDAFDKFTHIKGETLHNKFVTDVKLVKDLHTTNFDQLHAYLKQHKLHANEVRLLRERNQDPLAFVSNQQLTPPYSNTYQSSYNNPQLQQQFSPSQFGSIHPNQHYSSTYPSQPQFNYSSVPSSYPYQSQMNRDDPIACLNKAMAFLIVIASLRYKSNATSSGETMQADMQGLLNATTVKEKAILAEAQEAGQILDEEKLAFLTDPGVPDGQAVQIIIPNNASFQTEDLDTYDSDCDDILNAQVVLMANISNYGSDVISEVPHSKTYINDMENQSVHAMQDFEQTPAAQQVSMSLSVIEQMSEQMINHVINWEKANKEQNNKSITAEVERYKERIKTFEQRLNIDLSSREKMIDSQMDDMIREKLVLKEQVD
ncbi:hypothetical protein Tco_0917161 [Tanacetum coccineum]